MAALIVALSPLLRVSLDTSLSKLGFVVAAAKTLA